jgi:hypothetical protein
LTVSRQTRYTRETRERAYQLWASAGGRNASATSRFLREDAGAGEPVPTDRLIRYWRRRYYWTERATQCMGDIRGCDLIALQGKWLAVQLERIAY